MFKEFINTWRQKDLSKQIMEEAEDSLKLDYEMYLAAIDSLRIKKNEKIAIDVEASDKDVNRAERRIRKKVLTHLSIADKSEINAGLVLTSIVIDIERIGDYTKDIYSLSEQRKKLLCTEDMEPEVKQIEKTIEVFFKKTIVAFLDSDQETAREVTEKYESIAGQCDKLTNVLINGEMDFKISDAVTLALYLRYLRRIAAHLKTICTSIINPFYRIGFDEKKK